LILKAGIFKNEKFPRKIKRKLFQEGGGGGEE